MGARDEREYVSEKKKKEERKIGEAAGQSVCL